MPAAATIRASPSGLREKLGRVTGVRVLMVTLLFGSAVILNANDLSALGEPSYLALTVLIGLTLVSSALSAMAVRYDRDLGLVVLGQAIGDAVLSGGLVLVTGGPDSAFLFLFFLSIITTSFVAGRTGSLFSASACSVVYAVVVLAQRGNLPGLNALSLVLSPTGRSAEYVPVMHVVSFYAVAILAGNLAERLGQVGTELERRRIDVRALEVLNENIVNSVAGGLCTTDLAGRVIAFNPAAERITGWSGRQVLGRPLARVLPGLAEALEEPDGEHHRGRAAVELERVDGQRRFLDVSVAPLYDTARRQDGYILSFNDVTELRQLQEVLQRQRRLAAIGELSASIAHEIRNPLASISGSIEVLRDAEKIGDRERRLVGIAVREIDRLNGLIADFLSYARPRTLQRRRVDTRSVLEECVLLARQDARIGHDITFALELPEGEGPLEIEADPDALREILWNLERNAAEATGPGGTVTLRAKPAGRTAASGVAICVRDDGPGLSREARQRLFEPFFTTKADGTGLGLATAHRAVEAHGGLIWAEDGEDGRGTAFWIVLPGPRRAATDERASPDPAETAEHLAPSLDELLEALAVSSEVEAVDDTKSRG